MKYCQLTSDERYLISQLRKARCSVAEIAQVTGSDPEAAKSRLRYAMNKLREAIGDD